MASTARSEFVSELRRRFGHVEQLDGSRSLLEIGEGLAIVYIRYSKVHDGRSTFYGLRETDLRRIEGQNAYIAFLWDGQDEPLLLPVVEFESVFSESPPAADGQHKVQVLLRSAAPELYVARAGRHPVGAYVGWSGLDESVTSRPIPVPRLGHAQVQTLLGAIGQRQGLDVWIPPNDRSRLDWSIAEPFDCVRELPAALEAAAPALRDIDVLWLEPGGNRLSALYEVEHSTPIYSGLLRFNDLFLSSTDTQSRFTVVSERDRRDAFVRQLRRPTFRASGLARVCGFMQYDEVYRWHLRVQR